LLQTGGEINLELNSFKPRLSRTAQGRAAIPIGEHMGSHNHHRIGTDCYWPAGTPEGLLINMAVCQDATIDQLAIFRDEFPPSA
jgi:hypothetical protein